MTEPDDVVSRADALIRRRRSFVAKTPPPPAEEIPAPPIPPALAVPAEPGEEDDLPVLTDVVPREEALSDWHLGHEDGAERETRIDDTQVALLAAEIAHAIGEQLTSDLPRLIEAALIDAGEQLQNGVAATMETALRDFIARRKQLPLPLDDD